MYRYLPAITRRNRLILHCFNFFSFRLMSIYFVLYPWRVVVWTKKYKLLERFGRMYHFEVFFSKSSKHYGISEKIHYFGDTDFKENCGFAQCFSGDFRGKMLVKLITVSCTKYTSFSKSLGMFYALETPEKRMIIYFDRSFFFFKTTAINNAPNKAQNWLVWWLNWEQMQNSGKEPEYCLLI